MQSIVADTTPLNYLVLIQAADILDPSRCEGRDGSCKHSRRRARVDFAASCMVGSCEPETARRLVDLQTMFDRLRATTFRSPVRLMMRLLEQDAERKKRQEGRQ